MPLKSDLFFIEDEWLKENYFEKPRLLIKTNSSQTIFDDDNRPGLEVGSFWKRLKAFMDSKKHFKIEEIQLQFRSNVISPMPKKAKGYFFRKCRHAHFGGPVTDHFIVGYINDSNELIRFKFCVPALLLVEQDVKNPEDYKDSIIWN